MKNKILFPINRKFAEHRMGEIVTARVSNPLQSSSNARGKARPVILLRRRMSRWLVMGLTTNPTFADGTPRTPLPANEEYGLCGTTSFLWGKPTWICAMDVGDHIGAADAKLISQCRMVADRH